MNDKIHEALKYDEQEEIGVSVQYLGYQSTNEWKNTGRGSRYAEIKSQHSISDYAVDYQGYSRAKAWHCPRPLHCGRMCFN